MLVTDVYRLEKVVLARGSKVLRASTIATYLVVDNFASSVAGNAKRVERRCIFQSDTVDGSHQR